ncbi:hypothetical protein [Halalkalirubrum salinum]|uniref:hypothetical protein n=1 Tax=Halalkalirubrum salinum TaxID=2563889 RepID=UPI0010FB891A|nr:hypothetical protein [Halalkalirubrum salinum]
MANLTTWLAVGGLLSIAGSLAFAVYWLYRYAPSVVHERDRQQLVIQKRLEVYHDIMNHIVAFNRVCVGLSERHFEDQMQRLAFGNESELQEPSEELTATYQAYYYILDPTVREEISDYLDYVKTYHDEGAQVGKVLAKSGNVVVAMREDLELESIYPTGPAEPKDNSA